MVVYFNVFTFYFVFTILLDGIFVVINLGHQYETRKSEPLRSFFLSVMCS